MVAVAGLTGRALTWLCGDSRRRIILVVACIVLLLTFRWPFPSRAGTRHFEVQEPGSVDACIAAYLTETYGERDFVRTGTAGQPNLLAFGNDQMLVDLSAATLTVVLPAHGPDSKVPLRTATLPFPIQPTLGRRVTNDVTLVDAATGTVRTVSRVGSPGGAGLCPVVERIWAAHRTRKDLLILTVRLYNPGSQLVSLPISLPAAPAPFRSLTLNQSTARVLVHDLETDAAGKKVVAVLIVPTILDQLTAPPARSVEHSLLISVTVLPHLHVQSPAVLTPLLLESNKLMGMVATLRHNHEKAWDTMVPFRMALPHDWELSPVFHGAMYYLSLPLHGRALPSVSMDVGDCGEQRPLRDASIYPAIPTNLDSLVAFQQQWANTLHHLPCMLPTSGSFQLALLRAFFYAVSGVRVQAGGLRVQPSWDLPPGCVLGLVGLRFQEFELQLWLTREQIRLQRIDSLSDGLFVGLGGSSEAQRLQAAGSVTFPAHVIYVADNEDTVHLHRSDDTEHHGTPPASWSGWLVGLLVLVLILFHVGLVFFIYREWCPRS